jgi:hypothetical protein
VQHVVPAVVALRYDGTPASRDEVLAGLAAVDLETSYTVASETPTTLILDGYQNVWGYPLQVELQVGRVWIVNSVGVIGNLTEAEFALRWVVVEPAVP